MRVQSDERLTELRKAVEYNPTNRGLRWELGRLLRSCGELDEALVHFRDLHRSVPNDRLALEFLVWVGLEAGRADFVFKTLGNSNSYPDLLTELEARLESEPESENLLFSRYYLLYQADRVQQALPGFESLHGSARWGAISWNMTGLCLAHDSIGEFERAAECYRRAILLNDENLDKRCVFFNLACAQYNVRDFRSALRTLRTLFKMDPGYPEVRSWLAEVQQLVASGSGGSEDEGIGGAGQPARIPPAPTPRAGAARQPWPD